MWIPTYSSLALLSPCTLLCMPAAPASFPSPLPLQGGYTLLHWAVMKGHLETARLLLDRGAYKEAKDGVRGEERGIGWTMFGGVAPPLFLGPRAFGAFPAELEPVSLTHVLESFALSNALRLSCLRGCRKNIRLRLCL